MAIMACVAIFGRVLETLDADLMQLSYLAPKS